MTVVCDLFRKGKLPALDSNRFAIRLYWGDCLCLHVSHDDRMSLCMTFNYVFVFSRALRTTVFLEFLFHFEIAL